MQTTGMASGKPPLSIGGTLSVSVARAEGYTVAAAVAHHKTPIDKGGPKFGPLESLCHTHHSEAHHDRGPNEQQREWNQYIAELRHKL